MTTSCAIFSTLLFQKNLDNENYQGLKKSPIGQKLDFANHSYLCKGLTVTFKKKFESRLQHPHLSTRLSCCT
jgi:hypothetical protein